MKKSLFSITILFFLFYSICFSQSGWVCKNTYCDFRAIYFLDENTGWIGGINQLLKTTNGGVSWQPDFYISPIYAIYFVNNNTGFIGGSNLFRTTNRGVNWIQINPGISIMTYTCFSFINSNTGWIASEDYSKILKTTNGGVNWTLCYSESSGANSIFFMNDMTGWCARYKNQGSSALIKTTNGGLTWLSQNIDTSITYCDKIVFTDTVTGFFIGSDYLYKTTSSGQNWFKVNNSLFPTTTFLKFLNNNTGWISGSPHLIKKTTNGGLNFYNTDSVPNSNSLIFDLFFVNLNTGWYTGSYGIIKKTTNSGANWSIQAGNYFQTGIDASINRINENTIWAGINKTTNRGVDWIGSYDVLTYGTDCTYFIDDSTGFINNSIWYYPYNYFEYIYKTTNNGLNWSAVLNFQSSYNSGFKNFYFINHNTGWACGSNGMMYKTTNSGDIWTSQTSGTNYTIRKMIFTDQNTGYCNLDNGNLLKTTNQGINWNQIQTGATGALYGLFFLNANSGWITGTNGQIYKTTNSGQNWISQYSGTNKTLYNVQFTDIDYGWICGQNGIILKTINSGNLWRIDIDNIGENTNNIYFFDHNTGICYGASIIMRTTTGGATWVLNKSNNIPDKFSLSQNYPNPFNPSSNIRYQIPNNKFVNLIVYDMLGREVETLVNEKQSPGTYEITFDGSNYPSGVYFYKLSAGDYSETKKMVLMK